MKWLEAKVMLENEAAIGAVDVISDIFLDFGLQGTVLEEPGGEPEEGWGDDALPLPEEYAVIGYFPVNRVTTEKCRRLEDRLRALSEQIGIRYRIVYGQIDEEDWAESWKAFFYPEKITDRIVIKPTWRSYDPDPDDMIIEIDPGMAFGTGIHPTTSACIQMIESYLKPQTRMLDIGTGSGVLMIAAAKLGAARVVGVDVDEMAVEIAEKNLAQNRIAPDRFCVLTGHLIDAVDECFDMIVANILSEVVIRLLEDIHRVVIPGSVFIASGIIEKNKDAVMEKMTSKGFEVLDVLIKDGWATLAGKYAGPSTPNRKERTMSLITVDPEKCTLCGNCLEECPFLLLEMKDRNALPTVREIEVRSAEERCINCGHCMAVCPTGALTLHCKPHVVPGYPEAEVRPSRQSPDECLPIRPELAVTKDQMAHLLMSRRTHRAYVDRQIPRETIEDIIDVARYSPSGHNSQIGNWLVVSDKDEIRRLGQSVIDFMTYSKEQQPGPSFPWEYYSTDSDAIVDLWEKGIESVFRGAPHVIMLYGLEGFANLYAARSQVTIRLNYLEFASIPYGIRTVWNGFYMAALQLYPPAQEVVKRLLPEGHEVYDSMGIGYPKNVYRRIPLRNKPQIKWV